MNNVWSYARYNAERGAATRALAHTSIGYLNVSVSATHTLHFAYVRCATAAADDVDGDDYS